jgi:long-chain fatty acid transport protein
MRAGGFQLNEAGARAMAMGFAVVSGDGADASTIFYNPAGMVFLQDGFQVMAGVTGLLPLATFTGPINQNRFTTTNMELWGFPLPHLYAAYKVPQSDLAFGLGVFVPFGAGTRWNENWTGRNLAIRTYLQTVTINPNVAIGLLDKKLALSAGLTYSIGHAELRQRVINFNPEPFLNLRGDATRISWNAGAIFSPSDKIKIGVAYRHNILMNYEGNAKFSLDAEGNTPLPAGLNNLFVDGPGGTSLNLPNEIRSGISFRVADNWMVEVGFDYVFWSLYDTLRVNFARAPGAPRRPDGSDNPGSVVNPRNYYNAPIYRLGTEYTASETLKLRAGAFYDVVPVDAAFTQPILPDANRLALTAGAGLKLSSNLTLDLSYMFIYGLQRKVENSVFGFDGIYNTWAHGLSVSIGYRF